MSLNERSTWYTLDLEHALLTEFVLEFTESHVYGKTQLGSFYV